MFAHPIRNEVRHYIFIFIISCIFALISVITVGLVSHNKVDKEQPLHDDLHPGLYIFSLTFSLSVQPSAQVLWKTVKKVERRISVCVYTINIYHRRNRNKGKLVKVSTGLYRNPSPPAKKTGGESGSRRTLQHE